MFSLKEKYNFPTKLFVTVSLLNFLLLGGILIVVFASIPDTVSPSKNNKVKKTNNDLPQENDPFITPVPQLKNLLKGPITDGNDPFIGPKSAGLTIVEFVDYKCSVCGEQSQVLRRISNEYQDKVKIIWKDYPFYKKDSPSFKSARAARCAWKQDEFLSYIELLYQNNNQDLDDELFISLAKETDLNIHDFRNCLQEKKVDKLIMDNIIEANSLEITGIPFLYIGDQEIMGKADYEEVKRLVEIELGEE